MSERQKLDFAAIKDSVTIEQVMNLLSITARKSSGQYRCECPTHPGNSRGLAITPGKGFFCFSEKQGGDQIALYAHIRECSNYDAGAALIEHFRIGGKPATSARSTRDNPVTALLRQRDEAATSVLQPLDYLTTDHPAIELLGLTEDVCNAIGIGFANKGTIIGRIGVPLRLPGGELVGYLAIATSPSQSPLLLFPDNLSERCRLTNQSTDSDIEHKRLPDALRKMFRIV